MYFRHLKEYSCKGPSFFDIFFPFLSFPRIENLCYNAHLAIYGWDLLIPKKRGLRPIFYRACLNRTLTKPYSSEKRPQL